MLKYGHAEVNMLEHSSSGEGLVWIATPVGNPF